MKPIKAIIAEDEEPIRSHFKAKLGEFWPELIISAETGNGNDALKAINDHKPDIAFLDIKMPGLSGIDVARKSAGACRFVFITAYDRYAVEAFEAEAADYLLKPVADDRLKKMVARLMQQIAEHAAPLSDAAAIVERIARTLNKPVFLQWIKAQHRDDIRLVRVEDIFYFKALDKYTTLRTRDNEYLIRKSIKELGDELDPAHFWRVHRSTIVNVNHILTVSRSLTGGYVIKFKDLKEEAPVSRAYAHLFKQI